MNRSLLRVILLASLSTNAIAQPDPVPPNPEPPIVTPDAPPEVPPPKVEPPVVEPLVVPPPIEEPKKGKKKKKHKPYKRANLSGFFQVFYRYSIHTNDPAEDPLVDPPNFRVQRLRIALDGELLPWLSYKVSVDPRAPEVTGFLRDAYFSIANVIPNHKIRIGQQKTQFGYENNESSSELFYVNRAEVSDNLARGKNLRDTGIGLLGRWKLGGGFRLEDAITVVNGAGLNQQDDDTEKKNVSARVGFRYKPKNSTFWLRFGVSGAYGDFIDPGDDPLDPIDDFKHQFRRVGTDLQIDTKWLFVAAEFVYGSERDVLDADGDGVLDEAEGIQGWYVNLVGKTPYPIGPLFRVDQFGDEFRRFTFGAYYGATTATIRVLLNYELRQLKDDVRGDDRVYVWSQIRF